MHIYFKFGNKCKRRRVGGNEKRKGDGMEGKGGKILDLQDNQATATFKCVKETKVSLDPFIGNIVHQHKEARDKPEI
jgi:hypothetical protein